MGTSGGAAVIEVHGCVAGEPVGFDVGEDAGGIVGTIFPNSNGISDGEFVAAIVTKFDGNTVGDINGNLDGGEVGIFEFGEAIISKFCENILGQLVGKLNENILGCLVGKFDENILGDVVGNSAGGNSWTI